MNSSTADIVTWISALAVGLSYAGHALPYNIKLRMALNALNFIGVMLLFVCLNFYINSEANSQTALGIILDQLINCERKY